MIFEMFGAFALVGERFRVERRSILLSVRLNFASGFVSVGMDWRMHLGWLIGGALTILDLISSKEPGRIKIRYLQNSRRMI